MDGFEDAIDLLHQWPVLALDILRDRIIEFLRHHSEGRTGTFELEVGLEGVECT